MTGESDTAEVGPDDAEAMGSAPGVTLTPEVAHGMGVDMNRLGARSMAGSGSTASARLAMRPRAKPCARWPRGFLPIVR